MKRWAMCLTPAAEAAPSAARPARVCAHGHRRLQRRRPVADLVEEAGQVAGQVVEVATGGHDVDEAEQGGAQLGVARREVHGPVVQRADRMARVAGQRAREVAPNRQDLGLERGAVHGGDDSGQTVASSGHADRRRRR